MDIPERHGIGTLTATELVKCTGPDCRLRFADRRQMDHFDKSGCSDNRGQLDEERKTSRAAQSVHGIPIIVKDNTIRSAWLQRRAVPA